jgi:hypothetical protein
LLFRVCVGWICVGALAGCGAVGSPVSPFAGEVEQADSAPNVFTWNDPLNVFPATLGYTPTHDYDANHCELFVNGFGQGNSSVDGATTDWLEAYLSVPAQQGKLINAAMYTRAAQHGSVTATITLAVPIAPDYWKTGFTTYQNFAGVDASVSDFAFFVDVQRPSGEVDRLWQSNHGTNYAPTQVFALPPSGVAELPTGSISYASNASYLFYQRDACQ